MGGIAYSEQTVASGLVMSLVAILPAMIALANLSFGVKPTRLEAAGIAVGIAGVLLLVRGSAFSASSAGLIAVVVACVSWAVGSVLAQRVFRPAPGAIGFASQMLCGGVTLMAMSLVAGESVLRPLQAKAAFAWVYLTIFGSVIAFSAYMTLLARTSALLASSYSFVTPVIGLFLGVTLGGETVTAYEWRAVAVIIAGVTMLVLGRKEPST
jgi:drug/metabolite transporter (DMT)-like permease